MSTKVKTGSELLLKAIPPARYQAELTSSYSNEVGKLIVVDQFPRKTESKIHEDDCTLLVATDQKGSVPKLMLLSALVGFAEKSGLKQTDIFSKANDGYKFKLGLMVEFGPNKCVIKKP